MSDLTAAVEPEVREPGHTPAVAPTTDAAADDIAAADGLAGSPDGDAPEDGTVEAAGDDVPGRRRALRRTPHPARWTRRGLGAASVVGFALLMSAMGSHTTTTSPSPSPSPSTTSVATTGTGSGGGTTRVVPAAGVHTVSRAS